MTCTILIVDDSPILRRAMKKVAMVAGLREESIHTASNGREALDLLEKTWVDLILLDLHMPVMDGEAFLVERNAHAHLRDIPVAIVSTEANEERLNRLRDLGAKVRLAKPFEPEDLCRLIRRILGVAA